MALHRKSRASAPVMTPSSDGYEPFRKVSHPQKRAMLEAYAECATIGGAAAASDCSRRIHYHWLNTDPDYAEAFKVAHEMAIAAHEDEASRRAMGWDETHYAADGTTYTIRKYSDTMLIFRLKALVPDRYREAARRDERSDVSELLKAVLLELVDRQHAREGATPVVDWAPVPPEVREPPRLGLPAPPDVEEDT
jgi:hypothetical protein